MTNTIAVVDYGMGNLLSVVNALDKVGASGELVAEGDRLKDYGKIILPGVGAFAEAMENLRGRGLVEALNERVAAGVPVLGICLGMQLMCADSLEDGQHQGLGWVPAHVIPFPREAGLKVPHMGWNTLSFERDHPVTQGIESGNDVYFVHSYYVECEDPADKLGSAEHGVRFTAMFARDALVGMQFHPEKSQQVGLRLLANFAGV